MTVAQPEPDRNSAGPAHANEPAFPDVASARRSAIAARLKRPYVPIVPPLLFALAIIGGSPILDAAGFALLVLAGLVALAVRAAWREGLRTFYNGYAAARGLAPNAYDALPEALPLLRWGDHRRVEHAMLGVLPGGAQGALALFSYTESSQGDGEPGGPAHRFTVVVFELPGAPARANELYCEPRTRSRSSTGVEGFRRSHRLDFESVALDRRCEIYAGPADDPIWLRRLFIPSFVLWLAEGAPEGFGFQIGNGHLCAFLPGHARSAARLDELCDASATVAMRVAEEAEQTQLR
jgi:hypothetical protein